MRKFTADLLTSSFQTFDGLEIGSYSDANAGYLAMPEWAMEAEAVALSVAPMDTASAGFTLDKMVESSAYHSPSFSDSLETNDDLLEVDDSSFGCCSCIGCSTVDSMSEIDGAGGINEAPGAAVSLTTLANYLEVGYWNDTRGGTTGSRYFNISDTGALANFGTIYYNVTGFSSTLTTEGGGTHLDSNGISAARADVVRQAFDLYEAVLGINFVETTSTAGFVDIFFKDNSGGANASSRMDGGTSSTDGPIDYAVINITPSWPAARILQTTLHEIGHVLGLGHQGPYNGSATYANDALWANDSNQLTMMSYFDQLDNTAITADFARLQTPMSVDWLALDNIYSSQSYAGNSFGVSEAFTGNTTYGFNTNITAATSELMNDLENIADTRAFTIVDGGGIDTVDFSGFADDQNIDLRASTAGSTTGRISDVGGVVGNMTIAVGTVIENVRSGTGDDVLYGNDSANDFYGGGGDDTMYGGNGNDDFRYVNGEDSGIDNLYGGAGTDRLIVEGAGTYDMQGLNVLSIEEIEFNADGASVDKTVILSNKELDSAGEFATALLIDGNSNAGSDDAIIINMDVGIPSLNSVDISGWTFTGWNAPSSGGNNSDTITINGDADANTLTGSSTDDTINDSSGADIVNGGAGNDTLNVGQGADDINGDAGDDLFTIAFDTTTVSDLDGGADIDTFSIANYSGDYSVNLATGEWRRLSDNLLLATLSNIENVEGGGFATADDVITGSSAANIINGNDGDDTIDAGSGADTTNGGDGDDLLLDRDTTADSHDGGAGIDTIDYNWGAWTNSVTFDLATGEYRVGATTIDTFANFENLIFSGSAAAIGSSGANVITGGSGANDIDGGGGDDTLNGLAGDDVIEGGLGNDIINGGDGNDILSADNSTLFGGTDTINGGAGDDTIIQTDGLVGDMLDGGAGIDTLDHSGLGVFGGTIVNLATGSITFMSGGTPMDTAVNFENFIGDDLDEEVTGTSGANVISTNEGSDTVFGGGGNDTINGGDGDDTLDGGSGNDALDGGGGDDILIAINDGGTTSITGGSGQDTLDLSGSSAGWVITTNTTGTGVSGGTTLTNLNASTGADIIIGSNFDDIIEEFFADVLFGGGGNDTIRVYQSAGLDESYDGGTGIDTLDLATNISGGFENDYGTINLATGALTGTGGAFNFENVIGTEGVNTITGTSGVNILDGAGGDDIIDGGAGNDTINGGAGDDVLIGGSGVDTLNGGDGNDTITSDGDNGIYNGDAGDDLMFSDLGAETMDGGAGIDTIDHSAFSGNYEFDMVTGETNFTSGSFNEFYFNFENAVMGAGNDLVFGTTGANMIDGGAGADDLRGGDGNDVLNGDAGNDSIRGQGDDDTVNGGDGADNILGGLGDDVMNGDGGDDFINGQAGNDTLNGGDGMDTLNGASGDDIINGQADNDTVNGGGGQDTISGGDGNDNLSGAIGEDTINGDGGNDVIFGNNQSDLLYGGAGDDTVNGGAGNDTMYGGDDNDSLLGSAGQDIMYGDAGNDNLSGGAGGDDLFGGVGGDILNGGGGNDDMNGGTGADVFVASTGFGVDRIQDFEDGIDLVDFSGHVLANNIGDVLAVATQAGANVRIDLNPNNVLILEGFILADLDASDFIF